MKPHVYPRFVAVFGSLAFASLLVLACGDDDIQTAPGGGDASTANDATTSSKDGTSATDSSAPKDSSFDIGTPTDAYTPADYDAAACNYTTTCDVDGGAPPIDAGTVSGDTTPSGGNMITLSGHTSEWLTLRVTEDDNSAIGRALTLSAVLSAPGSVNYDLYLYQQTDGSTNPECNNVAGQSTNPAGQADVVKLSWGEGSVGNLSDDGETITIRVQRIAGECDTAEGWTLSLTGNSG